MKRRYLLTLLLLLVGGFSSRAQLNVQLLHQLVAESQSEHSRQQEARNKQVLVSGTEEANKTQLAQLKTRYRELQSRFRTMALAIDAAQIGLRAAPVVNEIIAQQSNIFTLAYHQPGLLPLAYDAERDMVLKARRLSNYLYGLLLSTGELNQMKSSDRRVLFGHVLSELRQIAGAARGLATAMHHVSRKSSFGRLNPFRDYLNQDKRMVEAIIRDADNLFKR